MARKKGFKPADMAFTLCFSVGEQSARCSAEAWVARDREAKRMPRPIPDGMLRMIQPKMVVDELRRLSWVRPYAKRSQPTRLKGLVRWVFAITSPVIAVKGPDRRHCGRRARPEMMGEYPFAAW